MIFVVFCFGGYLTTEYTEGKSQITAVYLYQIIISVLSVKIFVPSVVKKPLSLLHQICFAVVGVVSNNL